MRMKRPPQTDSGPPPTPRGVSASVERWEPIFLCCLPPSQQSTANVTGCRAGNRTVRWSQEFHWLIRFNLDGAKKGNERLLWWAHCYMGRSSSIVGFLPRPFFCPFQAWAGITFLHFGTGMEKIPHIEDTKHLSTDADSSTDTKNSASEAKFVENQFFFFAAILHPLWEKVFKSETTSFHQFSPKDLENLKSLDIRLC